MLVAITYHEDFGKNGFSVLKERIRPSFEKLMESGLVDGVEVQVFRAKPAPLELVEKAHTAAHMANMQTDPVQGGGSSLGGQRDDGGRDGRHQPGQISLRLYGNRRTSCLSGKLLGLLLLQ